MKKSLLILSVVMLFAGQLFANPVDVNTAKELGCKYLKNNVLSAKGITNVEHVYTLSSENGTPYLYVFNHENGYVVVAADDRAYPILGYDESTPFDENNIPDGMRYYLGYYGRQIQYAIDNELVAEEDVVEQWELLRKEGITMRTRMEKAVSPLIATTWDQGWPYNYYAPACTSYWTNNHCYAGCVATAMSQVMKFWNWPETGVGEHSYSSSTYGGTLSVNFGEATYNWSIMPNQLGSQANAAAQAVALLMYHCGVAVDMDYDPNGSGAHTEDVPDAVIDHFRYGSCTYYDNRDIYTKTEWEDILITQLDRGFPMVYAGSDTDGGHAFNCDGYNEQRLFHFNWGWSGSQNTYYQIDALNTGNGSFNSNQRAVLEMVPDYVYDEMVPQISTLETTTDDAITKSVNVSFTVPTTATSGAALTSVSKITLKRNGTTIQEYTNQQAGAEITYVDEVPEYGSYEYTIVGENNNIKGKKYSTVVIVGPKCTWKIIGTTTNFQGWNGGIMRFVDDNGTIYKEVTMANTAPLSDKFQMPEGNFSITWKAPSTTVPSLTITLKNSANENVYNFSGSSAQLTATLYEGNNDCPSCTPPTDLTGEYVSGSGIVLNWNCDYSPSKFKIYRSEDGDEYTEVGDVEGGSTQFAEFVSGGTYYYKVTAFSSACESTPAMTSENTDYVIVTAPQVVAENNINARLYPNPTSGILKIEATNLNSVSVYNLVGQKVYENNITGDECVINIKDFGIGIYMVKINAANGSTTQKISVIE